MPRNFLKKIKWCVSVAIVCLCPYVYAQSQTLKITKIKLQDYGWQPVPNRRELFGHHAPTPNLSLDHEDRVLVGFTVRESDALAAREHTERSFHILRFTPNGNVDISLVLSTDSWYTNGFYLNSDDQISARANGTLQWISKDVSNGQSGSWQTLAPCPDNCAITQSFSRQTLILRVNPLAGSRDASAYTIVDASSSPPRIVRTCSQMASMQITDKFAYRMHYDRDDDLTVRFPFCEVDHYEDFPMWGRGGGYVLNDDTLLKVGSTGANLLGHDGRAKFSKEMPKHDSIDPYKIATDERYDRFAFMVNTERGAHPHLDIGGHLVARRVVVLDATGKELASIPTDTPYHPDSNFALSPDGRRLAIVDQGVLTVVELE